MDQEPLVREQIGAGADFLREFEALFPVRAAFWLQEDEDIQWYFFVASEDFESGNKQDQGYGEAMRIARAMNNPNFDRFRIKLIGADEPTARAAMEIYKRYPARIPTHFGGRLFGGSPVEGAYIYPPAATTPASADTKLLAGTVELDRRAALGSAPSPASGPPR